MRSKKQEKQKQKRLRAWGRQCVGVYELREREMMEKNRREIFEAKLAEMCT